MKDLFQADYRGLDEIAAEFDADAQTAQESAQNLLRSLEPLEQGGFVGQTADRFFAIMRDEVLPALSRLQEVLEESGRATKDIGALVQTSEREAGSCLEQH